MPLPFNTFEVVYASALDSGDFKAFLREVTASGNSSFKYLQNIFAVSDSREQGMVVGLYQLIVFLDLKAHLQDCIQSFQHIFVPPMGRMYRQ